MNIKSLILLFTACLFFTGSCKTKVEDKPLIAFSGDHERVINKVKYFENKHAVATNQHIKNTIARTSLDSVSRFIADSMKHNIKNVRVRMTRMIVRPFYGKPAIVAMFEDRAGNEYWMKFDYNTEDSIYKSYQYKFLKNMPKQVDTMVSFFYLGDIRWRFEQATPFKFLMRIMPFPKDFNFDSAAFKF